MITLKSFLILDLILLLQCSFTLVQNKSKDPFPLAVQKLKASGISARKQNKLFVKYSAAHSREEKVKIVMDVILEHPL